MARLLTFGDSPNECGGVFREVLRTATWYSVGFSVINIIFLNLGRSSRGGRQKLILEIITLMVNHPRGSHQQSSRAAGWRWNAVSKRKFAGTDSRFHGRQMSLKTRCLAILPGAFLQTMAWRPWASTKIPQWQLCGMHKLSPSLIPTATRTASSSRRKPQLALGRARSQSPLCSACAARNLALCDGSTSEDSISARSVRRPGLSQNDCFPGKGSGGGPADEDQINSYWSRNVSVAQGHNGRMSSLRGRVLAAEARKAGIASDDTLRTPRPLQLWMKMQ